MFCSAIIVAAGKGLRMGGSLEKQFIPLNGKPILIHTIEKFENHSEINEIIVVLSEKNINPFNAEMTEKYSFKKLKTVVGGTRRQDSVNNALDAVDPQSRIILVHDGVRPFVNKELISNVIKGCEDYDICIPAVKVKDTIKKCEDNFVVQTLDRDFLYSIQTPQAFKTDILKFCYDSAISKEANFTDEAALLEALGYKVFVADGDYKNIKITTKDDLSFAEAILNAF